jgi:histone-lysine N-methyltransferase SETD3
MRGCHATADLEDDEVIIEIPLKCLITVEMGKDTDVGRRIIETGVELDAPKHIFLMIFMLIDRKNPMSFFKVRNTIDSIISSNIVLFSLSKALLRYFASNAK